MSPASPTATAAARTREAPGTAPSGGEALAGDMLAEAALAADVLGAAALDGTGTAGTARTVTGQVLVIAKEPVPGRVKTRLTPPFSPRQAADLARAALADTLAAVAAVPAARPVIALDGTAGPLAARPGSRCWPSAAAAWTSGSPPPWRTPTAGWPSRWS